MAYIQRLIQVIASVLSNSHGNLQGVYDTLPEIINNSGDINYEQLRFVETVLTQNRREDIVELIQQTVRGNYSLLRNFEDYLQFRSQFQESSHLPRDDLPVMHFTYTTNHQPVRQESNREEMPVQQPLHHVHLSYSVPEEL